MPSVRRGCVYFFKLVDFRQQASSPTLSIRLEKIASLAMDSVKPFRFLDLSAGMFATLIRGYA
jgi:hypothetical protein